MQVQASRLQDAESFGDSTFTRARFMLRRAAQEVIQACIQLRDVNGPRGGVDQQCRVTLVTHSRDMLVATNRSRNAGTALFEALRMAVQSLVQVWQRRRPPDRKSVRAASDLASMSPKRRWTGCLPGRLPERSGNEDSNRRAAAWIGL